jgi:hypothetical protein
MVVLTFIFTTGDTALAHEGLHHPGSEENREARVLGKIDFPTTTQSEEAQAAFISGPWERL